MYRGGNKRVSINPGPREGTRERTVGRCFVGLLDHAVRRERGEPVARGVQSGLSPLSDPALEQLRQTAGHHPTSLIPGRYFIKSRHGVPCCRPHSMPAVPTQRAGGTCDGWGNGGRRAHRGRKSPSSSGNERAHAVTVLAPDHGGASAPGRSCVDIRVRDPAALPRSVWGSLFRCMNKGFYHP
jgi:hypothetical protein